MSTLFGLRRFAISVCIGVPVWKLLHSNVSIDTKIFLKKNETFKMQHYRFLLFDDYVISRMKLTINSLLKMYDQCLPFTTLKIGFGTLIQDQNDNVFNARNIGVVSSHICYCHSYTETVSPGINNNLKDIIDRIRPAMTQIYKGEDKTLNHLCFLGSGFIYEADGLILTAAHILESIETTKKRSQLFVKLSDGSWYSAALIGASSDADVAVLKIISKFVTVFPKVTLAIMSDDIQIYSHQGDTVAAYGSTQYGDEPVAVFGTICQPTQSFKALKIGTKSRLIQLAMIAIPGFSGSPVFNTDGNVIAMIVKKFDEYALAIPGWQIYAVAKSIEMTGSWRMPFLGLSFNEPCIQLQDSIIEELELSKELYMAETKKQVIYNGVFNQKKGVTIQSVEINSPADIAGLKSGDIILYLNGKKIDQYYQVFEDKDVISGNIIEMKVLRQGKIYLCQIQPSITH